MLFQLFLSSICSAAQVTLLAVSMQATMRCLRAFLFTPAVVFALCPYVVFLLVSAHVSAVFTVALAIIVSAVVGCLIELAVYCPLRRKGGSPLVLLLASLGIYVVLQNAISLVFGNEIKTLRTGPVREGIVVLGARVTPSQIAALCIGSVLVVGLALVLKHTRLGKAMRAVAADSQLAHVSGIDSDRVILWIFAIGSSLAGVAGLLVALDVDMTPTMGMNALMMGVVAVIIGGVNSIPGIALGALLLGMAQQFGAWYIGSQWQDAIAFIILLVFLLFRPQGFMGRKARNASV